MNFPGKLASPATFKMLDHGVDLPIACTRSLVGFCRTLCDLAPIRNHATPLILCPTTVALTTPLPQPRVEFPTSLLLCPDVLVHALDAYMRKAHQATESVDLLW